MLGFANSMNKGELRDELAVERTRLANERTLLAYIRTALALAAAGAILLQFFPSYPSLFSIAWVLVVAGSGTTIDVAKELGRKVIGYDISPYREDIIQNDARKIPLDDNFADFVFIDSPYSDNVKYSDHPDCIGKISC